MWSCHLREIRQMQDQVLWAWIFQDPYIKISTVWQLCFMLWFAVVYNVTHTIVVNLWMLWQRTNRISFIRWCRIQLILCWCRHGVYVCPAVIWPSNLMNIFRCVLSLLLQSYHCPSPKKMPFSKMDPSCTIGFYSRSIQDFERISQELSKVGDAA